MIRPETRSSQLLAALAGSVLGVSSAFTALAQPCAGTWSDQFAGAGVTANIVDAVVWNDGTGPAIYAVGSFPASNIGGLENRLLPPALGLLTAAQNVAKWDGRQWRTVGSPNLVASDALFALQAINSIQVFDPDGPGPAPSVLVVGGVANNSRLDIATTTLQFDGASWQPFGAPLSADPQGSAVYDLEIFNGELYAAGRFTGAGFESIARWDVASQSWADVGGGMAQLDDTVRVERLAVYDDGAGPALYAGGTFDFVGYNLDFVRRLAKWDGTSWSSVPAFNNTASAVDYTFGAPSMLKTVNLGDGPRLLVGDAIYEGLTGAAATRGVSLAQLQAGVWSTLIPQTNSVNRSVSFDAAVYPGPLGQQLHIVGSRLLNGIAGQPQGVSFARLTAAGNIWSPLGGPYIANNAGSARLLLPVDWDLAGPGGTKLLLAAAPNYRGLFLGQFNGLSPQNIALWDGTAVGLANSGSDALGLLASTVKELDPDGSGPMPVALYIGHASPTIRGRARTTGVVSFDGDGYTDIGSGIDKVTALEAYTSPAGGTSVYACGQLYTGQTNSEGSQAVYRLDGSTWTQVGDIPFFTVSDAVTAHLDALAKVTVGGEPNLVAAGRFLQFSGAPARFVARYNGATWTAMDAGLPPATLPNGDFIYINGLKTRLVTVGGTPWLAISYTYFNNGFPPPQRNEIYRWNGASWDLVIAVPVTIGASFGIESVTTGAGEDLFVFGNFQNLAGVSGVSMVARWNGGSFESVGNGIQPGSPLAIVSAVGSHDFGSGSRLVAVVDALSTSGSESISGLIRLEGGRWEQVPGGITARFVSSITSSGNPRWGGLYLAGASLRNIGGSYFNVGTIESQGIARFINGVCGCGPADLAGGGGNGLSPDGVVDGSDFIAFVNSFSTGDPAIDPLADIAGGGPNGDSPDGIVDGSDFIAFVNAFSAGC